jgi:hypothetical protein
MKKITLCVVLLTTAISLFAQSTKRIGWFLTPEVGVMLLDDHIGRTVGGSFGLQLFKNHLKVGVIGYGRSGPINPATFETTAYNGMTYKGSSKLTLRADHGAFGLMLAPSFRVKKLEFDIPIVFGSAIGGFYLYGDDRKTPDGRRVSAWENELMNAEDAGGGSMIEGGVRVFFPTRYNGLKYGIGLHYTTTQGWKTYYDPTGDFYNQKFRVSLFANFGSGR